MENKTPKYAVVSSAPNDDFVTFMSKLAARKEETPEMAAVAVLLWQGFRPHDPTKMLVNQVSPEKSQEAPKAEDEFHENEG